MPLPQDLRAFARELAFIPWKSTVHTLRERFRDDRLGLTASSLTFTTTIALVPLVTVALAIFTAFPMFGKLQLVLQKWLVESLVPDNIARQVLGYLTQFAGQASRLGTLGVIFLLLTTLALMATIDRTLNGIWRVRAKRPLAQRVLLYWSSMTLGPLLLGASVAMTSLAVSASNGLIGAMPGGVAFLFGVLQYAMVAAGVAALYRFVPYTHVKWVHAWVGGIFVSTALEVTKKLLVLYLGKVPTYSVVYGAFATAPILLIWIYVAWVILLSGAVIAAYLPSLLAGIPHRTRTHGLRFQLALQALQQLNRVRFAPQKGLTIEQLSTLLWIDRPELEPVLETLCELDWAGRLDEENANEEARYVLLADPDTTLMTPLFNALLLHEDEVTTNLWKSSHWHTMALRQAL